MTGYWRWDLAPTPVSINTRTEEKEGGDMDRGDPDRDMGDAPETGLGVELQEGTSSDTSGPKL